MGNYRQRGSSQETWSASQGRCFAAGFRGESLFPAPYASHGIAGRTIQSHGRELPRATVKNQGSFYLCSPSSREAPALHQLRASATRAPACSVFNHKLTPQASVKDSDIRSVFQLSLKQLELMLLHVLHTSGVQLLFSSPLATRHHLDVNPVKPSASPPIVPQVIPPFPSPPAHPFHCDSSSSASSFSPCSSVPASLRIEPLFLFSPRLFTLPPAPTPPSLTPVLRGLQPSGRHGTSAALGLRQGRAPSGRAQA